MRYIREKRSVMEMTDWKKLIGKRVLLRWRGFGRIEEARILELSPSEKCVKVEWIDRNAVAEWYATKNFEFRYEVLEVLD